MTYAFTASMMDQAIADAQAASSAINSTLTDLEGELTRTLASWTGVAQTYYQHAQAQWHAAANDLPDAITKMASALQAITELYQRAETTAANTFGA